MKKITLLLSLFLAINATVFTQDYTLNVFNETYIDLEDTISLNNGMTWDDPNFIIPIGFDFVYKNDTIDTLYMNNLGLGGNLFVTNPDEYEAEVDTSLEVINFTIIDLIDRGVVPSDTEPTNNSLSPISYKLEGEADNHILKMEWKNAGVYDDIFETDSSTEFVNIQVWLYEGTNNIEIRYGESGVMLPFLTYGGLFGDFVFLGPFPDTWSNDTDSLSAIVIAAPEDPLMPFLDTINMVDYFSYVGLLYVDGPVPDGTVYQLSTTGPLDTMMMDTMMTDTINTSVQNAAFGQANIQAYPNPTNDYVNIQGIQQEDVLGINIYTPTGRLLKQQQDINAIDLRDFQSNVYFLEVVTKQGRFLGKIMKE